MLSKLSDPNSNLALTLGYLNPLLNNSVLISREGGGQWGGRGGIFAELWKKLKGESLL